MRKTRRNYIPIKDVVIVDFVKSYNGDDVERGGIAVSANCPCCKHSHIQPIGEELKFDLIARGVQIVRFSRASNGNVPDSKKRMLLGNLFSSDVTKLMEKDLKNLEKDHSSSRPGNVPTAFSDDLLLIVGKWSRTYESSVARTMERRMKPMFRTTLDIE